MSIRIEPIAVAHAKSFHRVVDFVARERKYLAAVQAPPLAGTLSFVQKGIDSGQVHLVALSRGEVIGWCDIRTSGDPTRSHVGVVGMGLMPEYRGQGLGKRLLSQALSEAKTRGLRRIELKVRASNERAIKLYEAAGFAHEGTLKDDVLMDGNLESTHCMALFPQG